MKQSKRESRSLSEALQDHSSEGLAIMVSEPSQLIRFTNYLLAALLCISLAWSFFGKADVIVKATGSLAPKSEIRNVYPPIEGELVDVYVSEGVPVEKGDVIARINARGAIEAASKALEARLRLDEARQESQNFAAKEQLMRRKAEALKAKLDFQKREYDKRIEQGMFKLASAQRAKLEETRAALEQARRSEESSRLEAEQYQRLSQLAGGGGVSKTQVKQKNNAYLDARAKTRIAQARLSELELELSSAVSKADSEVAATAQELEELRVKYESALREIEQEKTKLEFKVRGTRLAADAAERISFDNIDENNFLQVVAPVSGMVTAVPFTQRGDKIQSTQPLVSIAPADTERVLKVQIAEKDRGFLQVGQDAKIKFNAFPYQNYGFVRGTLEYISPTVVQNKGSEQPVYQGRIGLERDTIPTARGDTPLRYGMSAVAEIVVRERRLIDLALDPLRGL